MLEGRLKSSLMTWHLSSIKNGKMREDANVDIPLGLNPAMAKDDNFIATGSHQCDSLIANKQSKVLHILALAPSSQNHIPLRLREFGCNQLA